jgi:hypothetical protein
METTPSLYGSVNQKMPRGLVLRPTASIFLYNNIDLLHAHEISTALLTCAKQSSIEVLCLSRFAVDWIKTLHSTKLARHGLVCCDA